MPMSAFCLVADWWEVVCGRKQLDYHNFPGERVLFPLRSQVWSPLTPHQLYPVTYRAGYIFCLQIYPKHSPFILEKSDSAIKIQLKSHLLQEVGSEYLCIKRLFSDVPGLAFVYMFLSH